MVDVESDLTGLPFPKEGNGQYKPSAISLNKLLENKELGNKLNSKETTMIHAVSGNPKDLESLSEDKDPLYSNSFRRACKEVSKKFHSPFSRACRAVSNPFTKTYRVVSKKLHLPNKLLAIR